MVAMTAHNFHLRAYMFKKEEMLNVMTINLFKIQEEAGIGSMSCQACRNGSKYDWES